MPDAPLQERVGGRARCFRRRWALLELFTQQGDLRRHLQEVLLDLVTVVATADDRKPFLADVLGHAPLPLAARARLDKRSLRTAPALGSRPMPGDEVDVRPV